MSASVPVCELDQELRTRLNKIKRLSTKSGIAIIMKMDKELGTIVEDEYLDDCSVDDIKESLPGHQPRYLLYTFSHKHKDERVTYPLVFIFYSPLGCKTDLSVMYAASKVNLIRELDIGKTFEIRDLEEFTEEWLIKNLKLA
ncbi:glia maturation factor beta [Eurytemora carolleeae]|uniref:glia maturation factor beta n=1 Tax=Eurytemora carolleeae TaxID=1294199 RepID=UPI000C761442|nr:glia maturation factor beta [Eurytemora carolleeae]|eukprot:XP_023324626.1 glia maturation factor beta-like [Eurytemora affinis]